MSNEKLFRRVLSNQSTYSPPIRSTSLTSFKQYRSKEEQVHSEYSWIAQADEQRFHLQKNIERRQKVRRIINDLSFMFHRFR